MVAGLNQPRFPTRPLQPKYSPAMAHPSVEVGARSTKAATGRRAQLTVGGKQTPLAKLSIRDNFSYLHESLWWWSRACPQRTYDQRDATNVRGLLFLMRRATCVVLTLSVLSHHLILFNSYFTLVNAPRLECNLYSAALYAL